MGKDIARALDQFVNDGAAPFRPGWGVSRIASRAAITAMKERPLIVKHQAGPTPGVDQPAHRRAQCHGGIEHHRVQGDGVGQVPPFDHLQDEGLPRRGLEGVGHPQAGGKDQDVKRPDHVQ